MSTPSTSLRSIGNQYGHTFLLSLSSPNSRTCPSWGFSKARSRQALSCQHRLALCTQDQQDTGWLRPKIAVLELMLKALLSAQHFQIVAGNFFLRLEEASTRLNRWINFLTLASTVLAKISLHCCGSHLSGIYIIGMAVLYVIMVPFSFAKSCYNQLLDAVQ